MQWYKGSKENSEMEGLDQEEAKVEEEILRGIYNIKYLSKKLYI